MTKPRSGETPDATLGRPIRLVLLTTTDLRAGREADFVRMAESVRRGTSDKIGVKMLVLLQRCDESDAPRYQRMLPPGSVVLTSADRMSLSAARNRLLELAHKDLSGNNDCVVGFPDDDCWYPPGFPCWLVAAFGREPQLDMLACRVSLQPVEPPALGANLTPATVQQVVRRSSSNSMFFRGRLIADLGDFDPTLGLGSVNGGGEDTDYALRGLLAARRSVFVDLALVGHRESDLAAVARYFRGSFVALRRHAFKRPDVCFEFMRKIAVGAYLTSGRRLPAQEYWTAMKTGLRGPGDMARPDQETRLVRRWSRRLFPEAAGRR